MKIKRNVKKKLFDDRSMLSDNSMEGIKNLCDDELDDLPEAFDQDICSICGEFEKYNKIYFRCVHKGCIRLDMPDVGSFVIFV